jgi:outer membrane biosynthesis protein TonB
MFLRRTIVATAFASGLLVAFTGCSSLTGGDEPLAVQKFVASPGEILAGSQTVLTWEVVGAETVEIDNGIGRVTAKGSKQIKPAWTTTYSLSAKAGTSTASATLQVAVRSDPTDPQPSPSPTPSPTPTPSPSPTPTPSPSPSPSPTPTPSPSPSPSPTPTPSPTPSPTPAPMSCGQPVASASGCAVTVSKPTPLAGDQCIELTAVTLSASCPAGDGTSLDLGFTIKAKTGADALSWRRSTDSFDALYPSSGSVASDGSTSVSLTDVVLADRVTFDVVDAAGHVRLRFTVRHR